tara:strand:- start:182 stop:856 length:675 start_codon:yes stop_codon:yes gene_type:complete
MKKIFSDFLIKLSKNISRKNLHKLIKNELKNFNNDKIKVVNIGSGGITENFLRSFKNIDLKSIDINKSRNPDFVEDITKLESFKKLNFIPDVICCFEVLEHIKSPEEAVNNLFKLSDAKTKILVSVPFNFPIHDEPNDYFRFTKYGIKHLFKEFSTIEIIERDGWIDNIFVFITRLKFSKNYILKGISVLFILIYHIIFPLTDVIQKLLKFKNITTGYFIVAKK